MMNMSALSNKILIFTTVIFMSARVNPVCAHNTSWNKAVIMVKGGKINLTYRIVQVDILGAVNPGRDSAIALTHEEWKNLLPKIRDYCFKNTYLKINGLPATDILEDSWQLEGSPYGNSAMADTLMGVIEISRSWNISTAPQKLEFKPDLLNNVGIPVKWVVLLFTGDTLNKRLYQVITRGETAYYDFGKHSWVSSRGAPIGSGNESTLRGRLFQFVKLGFNHITLERIFKSSENPKILFIYLLLAIVIGALHSLSPGHGKALIGAYIIGTKGTITDALTLGGVTALSHTISVLILGVILLIAFNSVVPASLTTYLNAASGLIIVIIGIYMLKQRIRDIRHDSHTHDHHAKVPAHDHEHEHSHHEHTEYTHSHDNGGEHTHAGEQSHQHITMESIQKKGFWSNVMIGISGGMVPCPTALVVLFLAISVKKLALGLLLIVFFSFGLAATLAALGILFAKGSKLIDRYDNNRIVPKLPVISAGLIVIIGSVILIRSLMNFV